MHQPQTTRPTSDQLGQDIPTYLREYIDARISEALADAIKRFNLEAASMSQLAMTVRKSLDDTQSFERAVRSHVGL